MEESELLPLAVTRLSAAQQAELDAAFEATRDPLVGGQVDPVYDAVFRRITEQARNPIGLRAA